MQHPQIFLSPEWQQKPISDEHSHPPERCEPGADVVEDVVASGQQVPGLQLLRCEALGHLVIDDALHTSPAEIEDVRHVKLRLCTTTSHFLDLLFEGHWFFSNNPWGGGGGGGGKQGYDNVEEWKYDVGGNYRFSVSPLL